MRKVSLIFISTILILGFICLFQVERAKAGSEHNVSGWAWSENIGWISFNCTNQNSCQSVNYGVNIDPSTGIFSGYTWSENIGWISFNESDLAGCPVSPCQAKLDFSTNEVSGWAKALTDGGGWDGWIKLRDTNYGVWLDTSVSPSEFKNWAWSDMVIGWISFNCQNQNVCGTSNYKVVLVNQPPSAINLSVSQPDYCLSGPAGIFSWTFTDPDSGDSQSAYQVQVDNNSDFSSPEDDSGKVISSSNSYATPSGKLSYNTTYYWRVMVWDSKDVASAWANGASFTTPVHGYPRPDFTVPSTITVDEVVTFIDNSICYKADQTSEACKNLAVTSYLWDFGNGQFSTVKGNATTTYSTIGTSISVSLKITDDLATCSQTKTISVKPPLPQWKEIPPIIWLKNFLASVIGRIF